jgi:flagellar basal body-associated protein FliL
MARKDEDDDERVERYQLMMNLCNFLLFLVMCGGFIYVFWFMEKDNLPVETDL